MAAELSRYFQNPPDYCYFVQGTDAELDAVELTLKGMWSVIIGPRLLAFNTGAEPIFQAKYTFSDPNEAMRFRLSI